MSDSPSISAIIEAVIFASEQPVPLNYLHGLLQSEYPHVAREQVQAALLQLQQDCASRSIELRELASGYQYRVKTDFSSWLLKLLEERPPRYSRAFLETLALIVYRQPITRAEIEDIRGVAVSSNIIRTLIEHEWVKVVGHKEVPGRPALLATSKYFLDYFNLSSLKDLPPLEEFADHEQNSVN